MFNKINVVVIGYGSIGQRHTRILNELGHQVAVVSRRDVDYPIVYHQLETALLNEKPDYIVVANETSQHENTLKEIKRIGYDQKILVEKPLFLHNTATPINLSSLYVGYNLRFHPLIQELYKRLEGTQILSVQAYVGQYLPSWRPGTDYSKAYSAFAEKGGGVLRDLSHELDYLQFLFGEWKEMTAFGGKFSDLNIYSDDHFSLLYRTKIVPLVTIQMNYLDFIIQRFVIINTNEKTYKADFINNTLQINEEIIQFKVERDDTYIGQHRAILHDKKEFLCTYKDGLNIVKMIEMAEQSSKRKVWVSNE
jgi:predicted dehydrogenase